jgi:hypothetical protein
LGKSEAIDLHADAALRPRTEFLNPTRADHRLATGLGFREQTFVRGGDMAALGEAGTPPAGEASEDQRLMISQRMHADGPGKQKGYWVSAGLMNDAGTATATATLVEHLDGKALVRALHVLTSADGTLTLESHTWFRPFPPPVPARVMVEGTWKRVDGAGVYADMQASGRLYATVDQTVKPAEITIVRDGSAQWSNGGFANEAQFEIYTNARETR